MLKTTEIEESTINQPMNETKVWFDRELYLTARWFNPY